MAACRHGQQHVVKQNLLWSNLAQMLVHAEAETQESQQEVLP